MAMNTSERERQEREQHEQQERERHERERTQDQRSQDQRDRQHERPAQGAPRFPAGHQQYGEEQDGLSERDKRIRMRAYELWDQAGRPGDRSNEFWYVAANEVDSFDRAHQSRRVPSVT